MLEPEAHSSSDNHAVAGLQPGQRVRHRYEHWWGTIVQQTAGSGATGPGSVKFVVKLDDGRKRDDIRAEDLTVT